MFQTKMVERIKTCILCSITFFENRAVCKIVWKNIVEPGRSQMTIWRTRIACWIAKSIHTHTHNMQYFLLFHCNNGCTNALQCYVYTCSTLPVLFYFRYCSYCSCCGYYCRHDCLGYGGAPISVNSYIHLVVITDY